MRIVLVPLGSHGDVHPFIALGTALRRRGHDVVVIANPYFESLVRSRNLPFEAISSVAAYESATSDPNLWHPRRAARVVGRFAKPLIEPLYRMMESCRGPDTVMVAPVLAFGARLARERFRLPLVSVHLQPVTLWSDRVLPAMGGVRLPDWSPRIARWMLRRAMDRELGIAFGRGVNRVRDDLGMESLRGALSDWWNSPDCILGLFPEAFAAVQPDWPDRVVLTGFPLFDEADALAPDTELTSWLANDTPPLVFTPGSANRHADRFLATAAEVCRRLGRRGLLLSRYHQHLPARLPPGVRHADYLPLSGVLPHAAALVHHGGIGTFSQAAAVGIPQLIVPQAHDQFDNAARGCRLGIAETVSSRRCSPRRVAASLAALTASPEVAVRCRRFSEAVHAAPGLEAACRVIERCVDPAASDPPPDRVLR